MKSILTLLLLCCVGCRNVPVQRPVAPFFTTMQGYSNWPITKPGQIVLIEPIREDQIKTGMYLNVTWGSGLNVMHPVSHVSGKLIYLQGAWNSRPDAPITFDQVNGYWNKPN